MSDVTLTIDGQQVTVPEGTLLIRAAERLGIVVPRFCDHPLLAPVGACRQCLVDISDAGNGRGFPKPQASCTIPVAEGMVVSTANTTAVKAQEGIMEFLLVNHPLDCPVCDKGGECPLQNQAMSHGRPETRFDGVKRTFPKPINVSANILLDRERCIVCQRCTRFADEIAGDPTLVMAERGAEQQVATSDGKPFSSYFSGNVIQICPVGALTSAEYRFRSRPFDLVSTPGVAEHDACGAAIRVDHRRGKVMRRLAGNDPEVNEEWISDKDRFAFRYATEPDRLAYPQVRDEDDPTSLRPASWLEAFALAARGLQAAGTTAVLTGGRLTLEDARAYAGFARETLGTEDVDFRARPLSEEETGFLVEHVAGKRDLTYADLDSAQTVLLVGLEPEDEAGTLFLRLRKSVRAGGTKVVTVAPYASLGSRKLSAELVRTAPGDEAAALEGLTLPEGAVVLAGERLATSPGALTAAAALAERSGARLAWVPRRAGDRGAIEAGLLPRDGGRDADAIVRAVLAGEVKGLLVGGVDPDDTSDPAAFRAALDAAEFVVSLELRESDVTRAADVVLPVASVTEKSGTFVTWEGRERPFPTVFHKPAAFSDAQVLRQIGQEWAVGPVVEEGRQARLETTDGDGFETVASATSSTTVETVASATSSTTVETVASATSSTTVETVASATSSTTAGSSTSDSYRLATWKLMLDNGRMLVGDKALAATARPAVVLLPEALFAQVGDTVTLTGDRGSWTLPAEPADLPEDTVWVPTNSVGRGVWADLASPGSRVEVEAAHV
ncbi:NADH-quinone oxidoreductase subunit G [Nocardioides sp. KR10-350]|uniref:NADH-quinone oxidoreductase subunit G n=1 Tax=Nocardioides cheoyonin TaxID=3156615 RepID=UPI0032B42D06